MAKKIETTTTQHKREEMTAMRALWRKHHRFVAVMGCVVAMAASIALVVPVMSFTEDAADEVGIVLDKRVDENAVSDEIIAEQEAAETTTEEEASEEAVENAHVEADNEAEAQVVADEEIATDQIANDEKTLSNRTKSHRDHRQPRYPPCSERACWQLQSDGNLWR